MGPAEELPYTKYDIVWWNTNPIHSKRCTNIEKGVHLIVTIIARVIRAIQM